MTNSTSSQDARKEQSQSTTAIQPEQIKQISASSENYGKTKVGIYRVIDRNGNTLYACDRFVEAESFSIGWDEDCWVMSPNNPDAAPYSPLPGGPDVESQGLGDIALELARTLLDTRVYVAVIGGQVQTVHLNEAIPREYVETFNRLRKPGDLPAVVMACRLTVEPGE